MNNDMVARLGEFQAKVAEFSALANQLTSAAPQQAEGYDSSGCIRVVLDNSGLPSLVSIRDEWQQRLEPSNLGRSVMDASTDAVRQGIAALTDNLDSSDWWMQKKRLEAGELQSAAPAAPAMAPGVAREPLDLTEGVLEKLQEVQQKPSEAAASVKGSDSSRHVSVVLTANGFSDCSIDEQWAARRSGKAISQALMQAVQEARRTLRPQSASGPHLDQLLRDALATLQAVTPTNKGGAQPS
ncbi:hypothetical protein [Actinoplanes sp. TFC3]|uniref:hypothetical protein n=1 Tax=Actinoplanes sp. TFC3 TaxID=1710355 RepID=UPI00082D448B|nr:hypothetical protein [Actinoplanes sp. TFC3]